MTKFREIRLNQELEQMKRLRNRSTLIDFVVDGQPPDEYFVFYYCRGKIAADEESDYHIARIYLTINYPREPPIVHFLTPIFHPNIAAPIQMPEVASEILSKLDLARTESERNQMLEGYLHDQTLLMANVCLDTLQLNWSEGLTLDVVCIELGEMIQYKRFNPGSALNLDAAIWAQMNTLSLPIDNRSFQSFKQASDGEININILGKESND